MILAAVSPTAPFWQKQRQQGANGWQPQQPVLQQPKQQQQQLQLQLQQQQSLNPPENPPSRNSSGSSSPGENTLIPQYTPFLTKKCCKLNKLNIKKILKKHLSAILCLF